MPTVTETRPAAHRRELPRADRRRGIAAAVLVASLIVGVVGAASVSCSAPSSRPAAANPTMALVEGFAEAVVRGLASDTTARYATATGATVTVASSAPRRAYRGMGVTYILTPDVAYLCRATNGPLRCEEAPGADTLSPSLARALSAAFADDFVAPEATVARLTRIANSPGSRAGQVTRGEDLCVSVTATGIRTETACVSPTGLVTFFDGTADNGEPVRIEVRGVTGTVAADAFTPPA